MEKYVPDPKHIKEWQRVQEDYLKTPGEKFEYRSRCIEGLITGNTLDFKVA